MIELVRRARAGDERAFEALYRATVGRVYAVCYRLVGDRGRAEELTQEVFVHVWRHLDSFRGESAFSSWVHRIAVNVTLNTQRAEARRHARVAVEAPERLDGHGRERGVVAIGLAGGVVALAPARPSLLDLLGVHGRSLPVSWTS